MTLQINNLSKSFNNRLVLNKLTLELKGGIITGLMGANGAGKSTLFNILCGVYPIGNGEIIYEGTVVNLLSYRERAKIFSVVPQLSNLGGAFSVGQVVALGRTPYMDWQGNPSDTDKQSISKAIKLTNLQGMENRKISTLSGGERQRVLFARALAQETPVILLDEPTNNLDIKYQIEFYRLIKHIAIVNNKIVLMALHDLNFAGYIFDNVVLLKDGKIYKSGPINDSLTIHDIKYIYDIDVNIQKDNAGIIRIVPIF